MTSLAQKLRHAFAIRPADAPEPRLPEVLERLAVAIVDRGMETPAIIFLESIVPLSFLGSQALHAIWPLVQMAGAGGDLQEVAEALEDRRTVRQLAQRIEELASADRESR
jgi:hypothetical protein